MARSEIRDRDRYHRFAAAYYLAPCSGTLGSDRPSSIKEICTLDHRTVVWPPPDPNPRQPKLKAPPGTYDTHAHVFGPQSRYAFSPKRGYTPPDAPYEAYKHLHQTLGVRGRPEGC